MAKYYTNTEELKLIADAIREKGGTSSPLEFPNEYVEAIGNISSSSGGTTIVKNNVTFYDYDGTVVAGYSASDFSQLSAMPVNPSHTGLVAQGWNWSLSDAKAYVAKYGRLNIGQMYATESGATEIDVIMHEGRLEPVLTICVNGTITVDWGDNTTSDTVTGSSLSSRNAVPHTYAQAGTYTISISATENNKYRFYCSSQYTLLRKNSTSNENRVYSNAIRNIRIGQNAEIGDSAFYNCCSLENIMIPNSVTNIGSSAFGYCYSLTSITIPEDVTSIESSAFYNCLSLSSITVPNTVTSIGTSAFSSCYSLAGITIPGKVTSIGTSAFYYCYSLARITIPDGVISIGTSAFYGCYSLVNITIPDTVTSIGNNAFYGCYSIASVTIPDSVTSIGTSAFQGCYSLTSIMIPDTVTSIGDNAFSNCYSLASVIVPDGVTSIGIGVFYNCYSLASIMIPNTVTSIGNQAFRNCYGVKEYHFLSTTVPTSGTDMFQNIVSDTIIYVPASALEDYKTAENWSTYASYMQAEPQT